MMKDYYTVMGLAQTATQKDVKEAYRALAYIYHPDRHRDSPERVLVFAEIMMKQLNEAYTVLSDPAKREAFDNQQSSVADDDDLAEAVRRAYESATQEVTYSEPEPKQEWSYERYKQDNPDITVSPTMLRVLVEVGEKNVSREVKFHNSSGFPVDISLDYKPEWCAIKFLTSRRVNPNSTSVLRVSFLDKIYTYGKLYVDGKIEMVTTGNPPDLTIIVEVTIA